MRSEMPTDAAISIQQIEQSILLIRGHKVMLDADLAKLYEVETKNLLRAVKRNSQRFPSDFMFQLSPQEVANLRCHFGTSSSWGGRRTSPYVFTEQGVAMLSSVLRSPRAVQVNIEIMRAFVRLRHLINQHRELARKIEEIEERYDQQFKAVFDALRALMEPRKKDATQIGFQAKDPTLITSVS